MISQQRQRVRPPGWPGSPREPAGETLCPSNFRREEHMDMVILDVGGDRSRLNSSSSFFKGSLQ